MKYALAISACAAEVLAYGVIGAFLGWRHGGGMIPMLILLGAWGATWTAITGKKSFLPFGTLNEESNSTKATRPSPPDSAKEQDSIPPPQPTREPAVQPSPSSHREANARINLSCTCGKRLQVDSTHAGKKGKCPACGKIFVIPAVRPEDARERAPVAPVPLRQPPLPSSAHSPASQLSSSAETKVPDSNEKLATASLICGIAALAYPSFITGPIGAVAAIVTGILGLRSEKRGRAIAGMVLAGLALTVFGTLTYLEVSIHGNLNDLLQSSVPSEQSGPNALPTAERALTPKVESPSVVASNPPPVTTAEPRVIAEAPSGPTELNPSAARKPLERVETAVFDTTGQRNANGVQMKLSYPRTWKADGGGSPATVQRFISDDGRGNRVVLIQTFLRDKPYDRELIESEKRLLLERGKIQEAFDYEVKMMSGAVTEARILSHQIDKLNGQTCAVFEWEKMLDAGGFKVAVRGVNYAIPLKRAGLMLTCYVQGDGSAGSDAISREFETTRPLFAEIVASCRFTGEEVASAERTDPSFDKVKLAHGLSLSIPTSWFVFDKEWNALTRQGALGMSGDISALAERKNFQHTVLLRITTRANVPYGALAVNLYDKQMLPPELAAEIVQSDELLEQLRQIMHRDIASQAPELLVGDTAISALQVDGHPAVRFDYQRKSTRDNSVIQCHMIRVFLADKTYSVVSSYALAAKELYGPILDACVKSISITETGN